MTSSAALRLAPLVAMALLIGPLVTGLAGTLLPAFGWLPALGGGVFGFAPWRRLLAAPELSGALRLTLVTGVLGTLGAFAAAIAIMGGLCTRPVLGLVRACLLPLLAVPHLAIATGLAFLLAPSGWLGRGVAGIAGWSTPPDIATVNDPNGLALMLALVAKETPFLVLAILAASSQIDVQRQLRIARSLGYGPAEAWLKILLPQLYPQVRLPLYAVLAYGLSVVDVAVVLGPAAPPPLAVLLWRWMNDPDLTLRFPAAAGAVLLLGVLLAGLAVWRLAELAVAVLLRRWLTGGQHPGIEPSMRIVGSLATIPGVALGLVALLATAVWSLAGRWPFPATLPESWSAAAWGRMAPTLAGPLATTAWIGALVALLAVVLVALSAENEAQHGRRPSSRVLMLAYLPLLVPQIAFLFGFQVLLAAIGIDGTLLAVTWAHLTFVLPYALLMLREPWLALDPRYARTARALGKGPWVVLWRIKLPLLLRPLLLALAIGVAVSVAQYLPTLFAGGGRVPTLATETLALAAGGDRRSAAVAGLVLAVLPLAALLLAWLLPAWRRHALPQ